MKANASRLSLAWAFPVAAAAFSLASCAHRGADAEIPSAALAVRAPLLRLAQVGYGDQAEFIRCAPPLCPERTLKTLDAIPAAVPIATQVSAGKIEPTTAPAATAEALAAASQSGDAGWPTAVESQTWCVGFAFGSARLDAKGRRVLEQVAARLPGKGRITIAGRTDSVGPAAANDALAKARAETVRGFLARLRPELEAAITVQAEGGCCFAAANDTATGRARNRRVEITLETMLAPP